MSKRSSNAVLTREAAFTASTWNATDLTFTVVLSAGTPVERYDARGAFDEVLQLDGVKIPDRIPLLDSHNRTGLDSRLGEVTDIKLVGRELVGTARLSKHAALAQRVAAEIADGAGFGVSIGYAVTKWAERTNPTTKRREKVATAFNLLEASLVAIPADPAATTRSSTVEDDDQIPPQDMTRAQINTEIRSIARTSGLDQKWIDEQMDAEATLDQVRAAALAAMQKRSAPTGTIRTTATVGQDHTDPVAIRTAMADAIAHRIAPGHVKLDGRAADYRGIRILDMVGDLAAARGERVSRDQSSLLERAVGAHSTSDFPLLLADSANKALLAQYQIAQPTYRKWAARKPFVDFRDQTFLRLGDFPSFKPINQNGEFKYGTISEKADKVRAKEYGTGIIIGRQLLINDDLSALSDFSSSVATRAASDENAYAYNVLLANAPMSDGKALFHADHGNLQPTVPAYPGVDITNPVQGMRAQKSLDGMPLNLQPAFMVVGPAMEVPARRAIARVTPTKTSDVNVWENFAELVVDANIVDNRWYLFTSPTTVPVVVYGYVAGAEGPQIRTERDFETQAIKVAAGLDFAVGAIDFRGAYYTPNA